MNFRFKFEGYSRQKRHRNQGNKRQLPINSEHHNGAEQHHKKYIQQLCEAEADKVTDRFQVPG
ncbi:hypothetical protein D3C80_1952400 [compost metagenome]